MPLVQLMPHGAQDSWLTNAPDITFFRTTYTKTLNFIFVETIDEHVFARQILQIDWPRSKLLPLPDHITDAIFRLTDFETCLMHGRFETATEMFMPYEHNREWGEHHPCVPIIIRDICALLKDEQHKDRAKKARAVRRKQDKKLAEANRDTVKHVRRKHAMRRVTTTITCLQNKFLAWQLAGDKLLN